MLWVKSQRLTSSLNSVAGDLRAPTKGNPGFQPVPCFFLNRQDACVTSKMGARRSPATLISLRLASAPFNKLYTIYGY